MGEKLRIVVLGMMGRCPFAGQTWLYVNWLSGLSKLGHDVWYVEDDIVWPYDPRCESITDDCSYAIDHIARSLEPIGLEDRWGYRLSGGANGVGGVSPTEIAELYRTCDVLLNIVGATDLRDEHMQAGLRVYVETDPVSAELMLAKGDQFTQAAFSDHHRFATYGENYGAADCGVPTGDISFIATRQPIDLDLWPYTFDLNARYFTTVGNYRQDENDIEFNGQVYHWSKHYEWEKFAELPEMTSQEFELALMIRRDEDRVFLEDRGWRVISPATMSLEPYGGYRNYIQGSRAEFTVAKDQNVRLRSGWFSERDACYLAAGKPVIAQDTGFANILPVGEGLFAFRHLNDITAAIDDINADYERHCRSARRIAEEYFEAKMVAARLLTDLGLS